jgi:carotenoid cleavage dioxygenase-like enzyme
MSQPKEQAFTDEKLPFHLKGNFAPIFEESTEFGLEITGSIPPELNGRYLRNGRNPQTGWSAHWFLGNGMIHGVELQNGKATCYRNRYVRTALFEDADADPIAGIGDLRMSAANTHVIRHHGKILALEEVHLPVEVTPDLQTVGPHDFGGRLKTGMTAHPKICPETGELLFFAYGITPPHLTYHRVSADGELVQTEEIAVKGATMVHDFNVTRNHVIFMDLPLVWDVEALGAGGLPIRWSDDYGARLGVMPRDGTTRDVVWYDIDPCYVYHPMNAYEEDGRIVLDVCRQAHEAKPDEPDALARLHRWTVDPSTGSVAEDPLDDRPIEFPRIHDGKVGKKYRYGYTAGISEEEIAAAVRFHKFDLQGQGSVVTHELAEGRTASEPVFVPAGGHSAEDDGWVLAYVHDGATNRSELVILDASHFDREPVARIHLPTRVPAGFHGSWIPDEAPP